MNNNESNWTRYRIISHPDSSFFPWRHPNDSIDKSINKITIIGDYSAIFAWDSGFLFLSDAWLSLWVPLKRLMTFSTNQLEHKKFLLDVLYSGGTNQMNWTTFFFMLIGAIPNSRSLFYYWAFTICNGMEKLLFEFIVAEKCNNICIDFDFHDL